MVPIMVPIAFRTLALALCAVLAALPAAAQAPDDTAKGRFLGALVEADLALAAGQSAQARQHCRTAQEIAAGHAANPMWTGEVEACFGRVAEVDGDRTTACARYARAEAALKEAAGAEPGGSAEDRRQGVARDRARLGC